MSENYINQITLDYLINKENYNKINNRNSLKNANRKDKKFYRKRILNLTKDLLLFQETKDEILPDVKKTFEIYIKTCVEYFQTLDKSDILQEEYSELDGLDNLDLLDNVEYSIDSENPNTVKEADNLIMRSIKINSLDKYVKRTVLKKDEPIIPLQKDIDLHEPYLKNKGICKKKNITNN